MTASWKLRRHQIDRLQGYQISRRLDICQLKLAMEGAPFTYGTLGRALRGSAIQESSYRFIVEWLDKVVPEKELPDGKAAAANDAVPCSE
jgi:hypothetical protein